MGGARPPLQASSAVAVKRPEVQLILGLLAERGYVRII
eukprot:CAMPEP_0117078652 /NCGR_PEP_ID=MMETSP0472-20121206/55466_1 /TAXON_ID=693140 ORGANISM="Tiarina fusus, Strain LIS" /NCGR_SAMPLE_ID=MMETSP0472 /ASSEMBLY_ACC=CAM_ASM_000603 /LENGTH=37 /DNA_ID= /DNA_START= /DNA_END= /DNA_ORIENTATION=